MINCERWRISICHVYPVLPSVFRTFVILLAIFSTRKGAYPLLSGLCDVLVGLEETADVQGLAAPDVAVDGPVEGELQGAAVERAGHHVRGMSDARIGVDWCCCCSQDLGFGSHGRGGAGRRGLPMGLEGRLGHALVSAVWPARAGYSRWVCGDAALSTGPTAQYGSGA